MNSHYSRAVALLSLCMACVHIEASGQSPVTSSEQTALISTAAVPDATPAAVQACCNVPDGTIVELEIAEPISSKTAQRGQRFKLRLVTPLYAGETLVLPAGTEGVGEVVHADRARAAGKPGELLLAGRSLNGPNGEIKLRGFRLGGSGENRTVAAFWIPLGFLVRGGQIEIPIGARAHAKLAGPHLLTPSLSTSAAAPAVATEATTSATPSSTSAPADSATDTPPPQPPHNPAQ